MGICSLPGCGGENVSFQFFEGSGGGGAPKLLTAVNTCLDDGIN